jgi:5-methylcytosine-specific restriction endonuclease McrA
VNIPYRKIIPTRENIFKRDGFQCVYCPSKTNLTIDHVTPKSRGGDNTWLNMVTCCNKCNGKKDNKTPQEAGMEMRIKPFQPSLMSLIDIDPKNIIEEVMKRAV